MMNAPWRRPSIPAADQPPPTPEDKTEVQKKQKREAARRYAAKNPEKVRERCRVWRAENRERVKENNSRWYQENQAEVREKHRRWNQDNPDLAIARRAGRAAADVEKTREANRVKTAAYLAANRDRINALRRERYAAKRGQLPQASE
jgi:hypothetical protein